MNRKKFHLTVLLFAAILPAVMPAAGWAAFEHTMTLEIELEGDETCPTLITVSAQACDRSELIETLCAELVREGLSDASSDPSTPGVCSWLRPESGCVEVRERLSLEPGSDCEDDSLEGWIRVVEVPGGADTVHLVEIEIEIPEDP